LVGASDVVAVEERVQSSSVDEDTGRALNVEAPSVATAVGQRVVPDRVDGEGPGRSWLIVRGLGLDLAENDINGCGKIVLIELMMLHSGAIEDIPSSSGLHQKTTTSIDGNLA